MHTYYKPGCWNVICQVCGRQFKSDQVRKRWDGLLVCAGDYEQRHIADFLRVRDEQITVPYSSPEPADYFIELIDAAASQGKADIGKADAAKADYTVPL